MKPYIITISKDRRSARYNKWFVSSAKAWEWAWKKAGTPYASIGVHPT